ncbi:MAG: MerR family transcriptional regulator [Cytophagales bacterium]|nr:MerR family transcriptional regulator [Armatimonadota bacterium]
MNTLKAIATELVVPESTLRIYRDEFEEFVVASGEGRRRRYDEAATGRLKQIVQWKRNGWTSAQVRDALLKEAMPQARVRRRSVEERLDDVIALLRVQGSEALLLRAEIGALRAEIRRLVTEIGWDTPLTMEQVLAARKDSEDRED